jgi:hypothetical protein
MDRLKTLLDDLAREAPPYDVIDRAERTVRRRQRMVRLAPGAAGVAVVLVLAAGWAVLQDADSRPVIRPGTPATWLPSHVTVMSDPPPLPTDRGIGPAALLYFPSSEDVATGSWRIVTSDGRQYGIAASMDEPGSEFLAPASLSPDGRWLLVHRRRDLILRDLTGTSERKVTTDWYRSAQSFWSLDSRQLMIVRRDAISGADVDLTVVDLESGVRSGPSPLATPQGAEPLGVDRSGHLVLRSVAPDSFTLWFVDPGTGRERRHLVVNLRTLLAGSADQSGQAVFRDAKFLDDESLLVEVTRGVTVPDPEADRSAPATKVTADSSYPGDILLMDLNTGQVTRRLPLPGPLGELEMRTASPEALLFFRSRPAPGGPFTDPAQPPPGPFVTALEQLDPKTGELRVVTSVTGNIEVLLPRGVGVG